MAGDIEPNPGPRAPTNKTISVDRWKRRNEDKKAAELAASSVRKTKKRVSLTEQQKETQRVKDTAEKQKRRLSLTEQQKETERIKDTAEKQKRRSSLTEQQKETERIKDTAEKQKRRSSLTEQQKETERIKDTAEKQKRRSSLTEQQKETERIKDTAEKQKRRSSLTEQQKETDRIKDTAEKQKRRSSLTEQQKETERIKDTAEKQKRRSSLTEQQKETERIKDTAEKQKRRSSLTEQQKETDRIKDTAEKQKRRSSLTEQQKETERIKDTAEKQKRRSSLTEQQKETERIKDTAEKQKRRSSLTEQQKETERIKDTAEKQKRRSSLTEQQKETDRIKDTAEKQKRRSSLTEQQKETERIKDTAEKQKRRSSLTEQQKETERIKDTAEKQKRRSSLTEQQKETERIKDTAEKQKRRSSLTEQQKETERIKDTAEKQKRRSSLTEQQKETERIKDTAEKQKRRSSLTEQQKETERIKDTAEKQKRRSSLTEQQKETERIKDTAEKQKRRSSLTEQQKETERIKDTAEKQKRRLSLTEQQKETERIKDTAEKQKRRSSLTEQQKETERIKDTAEKQKRRLSLTEQQKETERIKDTAEKQKRRSSLTEQQKETERIKDTAEKQKRRSSLTEQQKETERIKDTAEKQKRRSSLTEQQKETERIKDTAEKQKRRSSLTEQQKETERIKDTAEKQKRRSSLTEQQKETERIKDTAEKQKRRSSLTEQQKETERIKDTAEKQKRRSSLTEQQKETERIKDTAEKQKRRSSLTEQQKETERIKDTAEKQKRRSSLTEQQKETERIKDTAEKQKRRSSLTEQQKETERIKDTAEKQKRRSSLTEQQKETERIKDTAEKQKRRSSLTEQQKETERIKDTAEKQKRRSSLTEQQKETERIKDTAEKQKRRSSLTEQQKETERIKDTAEKQKRRSSLTEQQKETDRIINAECQAKLRSAQSAQTKESKRVAAAARMTRRRSQTHPSPISLHGSADNVDESVFDMVDESVFDVAGESVFDNVDTQPPVSDNVHETHSVPRSTLEFHKKMSSIRMHFCELCRERSPMIVMKNRSTCKRCFNDKHQPRLFSNGNEMDPGGVPNELLGLTPAEEMLIARVAPMMWVYRLPYGQHGYRGNVINLPQMVNEFLETLPRRPSELDILVVRKVGSGNTHRDFRVRRRRVREALHWLKDNNRWYSNINIDEDILASLPEDGNIDIPDIVLPADENDSFVGPDNSNSNETEAVPLDTAGDDELLEGTVLPAGLPHRCEGDIISDAVGRLLATDDAPTGSVPTDEDGDIANPTEPIPVEWPRILDQPVDEFESIGYMAMAFPTLFPYGATDYNDIKRRWDKEHNVKLADYFAHLMKYDDQRFARHRCFRYFALNTVMRHRAMATGNFYLKQHPRDAALDMDDLLQMNAEERKSLYKRITRYGSSLRGSKAYWLARQSELVNFIDQMPVLPSLFFTVSSADLQWPELHDLMPGYSSRAQAVNENPLICDWFFYKRVEVLLETVLPALGMTDFWLRKEWQHRGSIHAHGVMYSTLPDGLNIPNMAAGSSEEAAKVVHYYHNDIKITCINPAKDINGVGNPLPPSQNPCAVRFADISDYSQDLSDLVRTCQLHSRCMPDRCLRLKDGKYQCRFHFPKDLRPEAEIVYEEEDGERIASQFEPQRNDPIVNNYIATLLQAHRANIDAKAVLTTSKLLSYIVKYIGKPDSRSTAMRELFDVFLARTDPAQRNAIRKLTQRILISSISDRDYSAQEVMHLLMGLSLYKCSRTIVHLSLRGSRTITIPDVVDDEATNEPTINSNAIDKYILRGTNLENLSMREFYQKHYVKGNKVHKYHKTAIVVPHPAVRPVKPDNPHYEDYCLNYLILHRPFRTVAELTAGFENAAAAYASHIAETGSGVVGAALQDQFTDAQTRNVDDSEPDENHLEEAELQDDWQILARINPEILVRETAVAGGQVINWDEICSKYDELDFDIMPNFINDNKTTWQVPAINLSGYDYQKLNESQLRIYNLIEIHSCSDQQPLRIIIYGPAGTGKSYVLRCLQRLLGGKQKTICPTGISAHEVGGSTAHSALKIPVNREFVPLEGSALAELQHSFAGVKYVFADEMSMFGGTLLGKVDSRLREACPTSSDEVFGGLSFIFLGDHAQLPPVRDVLLYASGSGSRSDLADRGRRVYQTFDHVVWLQSIVRQNTTDGLIEILNHLRNAVTTIEDFKLLTDVENAAIEGRLSPDDVLRFRMCKHTFSRCEPAALHNEQRLAENSGVITIHAAHTGPQKAASNATSELARGLSPILRIATGAKVHIVGFNLWTEVGLSNGSEGTVKDIIYRNSSPPAQPTCVLVDFPGYSGPAILRDQPHTVAIVSQTAYFTVKSSECSRTQIPLQLSYGSTIHKVQGKTLPATKVDMGETEFSSGLMYTGVSRTRSLKDLMTSRLTFRRYQMAGDSRAVYHRLVEEQRLAQLDGVCIPPVIPTHLQKYAETQWSTRRRIHPDSGSGGDDAASSRKRRRQNNDGTTNNVVATADRRIATLEVPIGEEVPATVPCTSVTEVQPTLRQATTVIPAERHFIYDFAVLKLRPESEQAAVPWGFPISCYLRLRSAGNGDCMWNSLAYFTTGNRSVSTIDAMDVKHKTIELINSAQYADRILEIFAGTDSYQVFESHVQNPLAYLTQKRSPNNRALTEEYAWGQAEDLEFVATAAQSPIELVTAERTDDGTEYLHSRVIQVRFEMPQMITFIGAPYHRPTLFYNASHFDPLIIEH